uniref:Uncharacterized protein n=1 Tax=Schistosoma mansoni TaxID=6183 RepID=A0A146MGG4_SCHMA
MATGLSRMLSTGDCSTRNNYYRCRVDNNY